VGAAIGAAIGKAVCEVPAEEVYRYYGRAITDFSKSHPSSPYDFLKPEEVPAEVILFKIALETLVEAKGFNPQLFVEKLLQWLEKNEVHRYLNPTLLNVLRALKGGEPPEEVYFKTSSINAILHTLSMGLFHYDNATLAAAGARAMAVILARGGEIEEGAQIIGAATALLLEGEIDLTEEEGKFRFLQEVEESCPELAEGKKHLHRVREALEKGLKPKEAILYFGNGEYVWESLPLALYLALADMRYPQRAFLNAVNSYGDFGGATPAVAFLVGGWIGAYWGVEVFPPQWVERVEFSKELLQLAEKLYELLTS